MRRYKAKEVAECQTVIQCSPFILNEGETATVVSNQTTQTLATSPPYEDNMDFYPQLKRINPQDIQDDAIKIIKYKANKHLTFEFPENASERTSVSEIVDQITNVTSCDSIINNVSSIEPLEGYEDKHIQTDLMVFPHFLRDNDYAVVSVNIFTQTSVSCEPQTSISDVIPMLRMFMEHDGLEIELPNDTVENGSVVDILLGIIKEIENSHNPAGPNIMDYLQTTCIICRNEMTDADETKRDSCEAACHETPSVVTISKETQVEDDLEKLSMPPPTVEEDIPVIEEPTTEDETSVEAEDETSAEAEDEISVEAVEEPTGGETLIEDGSMEESDIPDEELVENDDLNEEPLQENGMGEGSCFTNGCQSCICNGFVIRLHINNIGLTAESDPSKDACLELNILPELQNISVKLVSKEEEDAEVDEEEKEICESVCCIDETNKSRDVKQRKTFTLPDGRVTECPVIVSKINKEGKRYFCKENEVESTIEIAETDEIQLKPVTSVELETDLAELEAELAEPDYKAVDQETVAVVSEIVVDEPEIVVDEPEIVVDEPEIVVDEPEIVVDEPEIVVDEPETEVAEFQAEEVEREADLTEPEAELVEPEVEVAEPEPEVKEEEESTQPESPVAETVDETQKQDELLPSEQDNSEKIYCKECAEVKEEEESTQPESPVAETVDETQKQDELLPSEQDNAEKIYCKECAEEDVTTEITEPETVSQTTKSEDEYMSSVEVQSSETDNSETDYCIECTTEDTSENPTEVESAPSSTNENEKLPPCYCDDDIVEEIVSDTEQIEDIQLDVEESEPVEKLEELEPTEEIVDTEEATVMENIETSEPEERIEIIEPEERIEIIEPEPEDNIEENKPVEQIEETEPKEDIEEEEEEQDFKLPFCEKKVTKKKRSRPLLESRAMAITNLLNGTVMALVTRISNGFDVTINIKNPPFTDEDNRKKCACHDEQSSSNEDDDDNEGPCCHYNIETDTCSCDKISTTDDDNQYKQQPTEPTPCNICNVIDTSTSGNVNNINQKHNSGDEFETCSEGPNTSRNKKSPQIIETNPNLSFPSTNAQIKLPDNTVLNLVLSLDMKNYDQICLCGKHRQYNPKINNKNSNLSVFRKPLKERKFYNLQTLGNENMCASPSFLKDINSYLFSESSRTINILSPSVSVKSTSDDVSIQSVAAADMYPSIFNFSCDDKNKKEKNIMKKISFRHTIQYASDEFKKSGNINKTMYQHTCKDKNVNQSKSYTCTNYHTKEMECCKIKKPKSSIDEKETKSCICTTKSKQNKISDTKQPSVPPKLENNDEKQDVVYMAFKACEEELKPVITALTNLRQELKNLNMPEVDSIFSKLEVFPDIPRQTAFQKKVLELNQTDVKSQVSSEISKVNSKKKLKFNYKCTPQNDNLKSEMYNVPKSNKAIASYRSSRSPPSTINNDSSFNNSSCKCKYSKNSSRKQKHVSLSSDSNTNNSNSFEYQNSNYTYQNTQFNYDPLNKKSKPATKCKRKYSSKLTFHTNPTYDSAYYSYPKTPVTGTNYKSSSTLSADSNSVYSSVETIKENKFSSRCNKKTSCCSLSNTVSQTFGNYNESSSSRSNVSSHVSSEDFIYPSYSSSYCEDKHGKKRKRSNKICNSSNVNYCPFLETMKSVLYLDSTPSKKGRKCC